MRTFSLRNNRRLQNLFAILRDLERKGLACGVMEDGGGRFFVRGKRSLLSDAERAGIDVCREGLREAWLLTQDRCIRCGLDPAQRPNPQGRVCIGDVYNVDSKQMEYRYAPCSSLLVYPFLCDDCYDDPQTWRGLTGEPKHADSAENSREGGLSPSDKADSPLLSANAH
jgi:hypothetical protein